VWFYIYNHNFIIRLGSCPHEPFAAILKPNNNILSIKKNIRPSGIITLNAKRLNQISCISFAYLNNASKDLTAAFSSPPQVFP
jgi:hypothetical protein